ncbi:helix-turn-helix transcriptional regulator [Nocardioides gansuensis]|nr:helix-turn-helix domain-containing protein [Nocardioides gansuensis]
MSEEALARRVHRVGALADPVRRALYRFVAAQPGAVSRDQAADGIDVPRHTAKHHLDKLVDEGLLVTEFRRLTGRTGPGAGRPAKLYRRARREIGVSIPARRYDLAGSVLADAVHRTLGGTPMRGALEEAAAHAAAEAVADLATAEEARAGETPVERTAAALAPYGYEPSVESEVIELANCPFDRLARDHPDVMCGLNREFLGRVVGVTGDGELEVEPRTPARESCCARVRRAGGAGAAPTRSAGVTCP